MEFETVTPTTPPAKCCGHDDALLLTPASRRGDLATAMRLETDEVVTTLYVRGFPADVMYREVHNMFRFQAGYLSCVLRSRAANMLFAFVLFDTFEHAIVSRERFMGYQFDPDDKQTLQVEFANRNYIRDFTEKPTLRRIREENSSREARPSPSSISSPDGFLSIYSPVALSTPLPPLPNFLPCSNVGICRVFVSNIDLKASHSEVQDAFSSMPGYLSMEWTRDVRRGGFRAWVTFFHQDAAVFAMGQLRSYIPRNSTCGPIRISLSRASRVLFSSQVAASA